MPIYTSPKVGETSDMFLDAMFGTGIGSDDLTCDFCKKNHLCPDTRYSDSDTWKEYCETEMAKNPDKVVLHYGCDAVTGRYMDNKLFVIGCDCNGLARYENFIWQHRDTIRNYLKLRIESEHRWAEEELTLNKLAGI